MKLRLEAMELLLKRLDEPHMRLKAVHVTGSKGKGSVCSMVASILQQAGYRVGLFTSPHLIDYTERFRVNGREIPRKDIVRLANIVRDAAEKVAEMEGREMTFFEITTALCFLYFCEQNVDFAVLEVGLGGRLDATNVCLPVVTVITNIDYEHTEHLGNTLSSIAGEKAGIIKEGVPVICGENDEEALNVIRNVAEEKHARLFLLNNDIKVKILSSNMKGSVVSFITPYSTYLRAKLPLLGEHQVRNAALAVGAIDILRESGHEITKKDMLKGLSEVRWPGRLDVVGRNPLTILDCAHTVKSAETLGKSMKFFKYKRLVLVIGISKDKDVDGILQKLIPIADIIVGTRAPTDRACEPSELENVVRKHGKDAFVTDTVKEAIRLARTLARSGDAILVTGSIFTVSEALQTLRKVEGDKLSEQLKPMDIDLLIEKMSRQPRTPTLLKSVSEQKDPFKVLIATILSQRTRDENTHKATEQLFSVYKNPKALAEGETEKIEELIRPSGFYRVKAAKVKEVARIIREEYRGKVPDDLETLLALPGVGRKTANCVLVYGFGKPAIPVDTHVHRISNRLGLVCTSKPDGTEEALRRTVPERHWVALNDLFVRFGQTICRPIGPRCPECSVNSICQYYRTQRSNTK